MGIPHVMSADLNQPWWQPAGTTFTPHAQLPQSQRPLFGITGHQVGSHVQEWVAQHVQMDAYQAFAKMTKQDQTPTYEVPIVNKVHDTPANDVDTFSDGSFNHPACPFFAVSNSA
eukprot:2348053-Karenia_brevis.AAC.1